MSETRSDVTFDAQLAATARSVLGYPDTAQLVVDGVPDALEGAEPLGVEDVSGVPTFACPPGSSLAAAAAGRRSALLTLTSGLGEPASADHLVTVTLAGHLESRGRQDCPCCTEVREVVVLSLNFVLLSQPGSFANAGRPEEAFRVPLADFRSPEHVLNRGYLRRTVEHANQCHQPELRRAVARRTRTRYDNIDAVALADLHRDRVEVHWVDSTGAHTEVLTFPHPARTAEELGRRLRRELDTRLC
ncbi:MAG: hypothetical protein ABWX84_02675 [Nocardioides sp.]